MRIEQTHIQRSKAIVHGVQALVTFIAGCLALAVLTKDGGTGGQVGFYFALCFLSIPALIYQVMVPMWTRAWRFANIYAYLALDLLFTLLWFAAFIAVAVWQSRGLSSSSSDDDDEGDDDTDGDSGSCSNFAFGSASKCTTTKASVGFGVVICLLWALTSGISIYTLRRYKRTGERPDHPNNRPAKPHSPNSSTADDEAKDAWNPNMDDDHTADPGNNSDDEARRYGQPTRDDEHSLLPTTNGESPEPHPGRQLSFGSGHSARPATYDDSAAPSALSPTGYRMSDAVINPFANPAPYAPDDVGQGPVRFPQGPY